MNVTTSISFMEMGKRKLSDYIKTENCIDSLITEFFDDNQQQNQIIFVKIVLIWCQCLLVLLREL